MPPRTLSQEELDRIRRGAVADIVRPRAESVDMGSSPIPANDDDLPVIDLGDEAVFSMSASDSPDMGDDDEAPISRAPSDAFRTQDRPSGLRSIDTRPIARARSMPAHEAFPASQSFRNRASAFDAAQDPVAGGMPRGLQALRASDAGSPPPAIPLTAEAPSETFIPGDDATVDEQSIVQREREEAYGMAAPARAQSAPQLPRDEDPVAQPRMSKAARRPIDASQFGPSEDEARQLQDAQRGDLRADRARRAMSTIGAILRPLAGVIPGIGIVSQMASGSADAVRPHNERQDGVREQIAERLRSTGAMRAYEDQQNQQASQAQRQSQQDARQAMLDEANLGLTRERTGAIEDQRAREEIAATLAEGARTGNIAAARGTLRARVNAIQHPATRAAWQATLDEMLRSEDPDQLLRQTDDAAATDMRRGGQGAGGSGGGGGDTIVVDAQGRVHVRRAPRDRGDGAPRPLPGPVPAPTPDAAPLPADAPLNTDDPGAVESWMQRTLNRAGLDDADTIFGHMLEWRRAPTDSARSAVLARVNQLAIQAERDDAGGVPAGVLPAEWTVIRRELTPLAVQHDQTTALASRVSSWARSRPLALRAAMMGTGSERGTVDAVTLAQADDILAEISRYVNPLLRERSGAAVTSNELMRMLSELGAGRAIGVSGEQFLAQLNRQLDTIEAEIDTRSRDLNPRGVEAWNNAHFGGN